MASLLTFALPGTATTVVAPSITVAPSSIHSAAHLKTVGQASKSWGGMASACATVSATVVAVVGRAMSKANRKRSPTISALRAFDPSQEVGAMAPFGYWDPLHLMKEGFKNPNGATKSKETFDWYRAAEIKHGRISMMALLGLAAGELYKWPGFEDVPGGIAALDTEKGGAGFGCIFLVAGILELDTFKQDPNKEPGNFGDPAGWTRMDGSFGDFWAYDTEMRNKELAHCRLAMSGVIMCFLLEYAGYDSSIQFTSGAFPPPFVKEVIPVLAGLWWCVQTGDQFYVADDSAAPALAMAGAAGSLPAAAAAPVSSRVTAEVDGKIRFTAAAAAASTGGGVTEKVDGRYRFKA